MNNYIFYFLGQVFIILLTCKIFDVGIMKMVSWYTVFIPLGLMVVIPILVLMIGLCLNLFVKYKKSKKKILKG